MKTLYLASIIIIATATVSTEQSLELSNAPRYFTSQRKGCAYLTFRRVMHSKQNC